MENENNPIEETRENLVKEIEITFYRLKEIELKYVTLAKELEIYYPILSMDETKIPIQLEEIKQWVKQKTCSEKDNIEEKTKEKKEESKEENTRKDKEREKNLKEILEKHFEKQYETEMKKYFQKVFAQKIQRLMKDSQLEKIEQEKENLKKEEINFLGKITGDKKIHSLKLEIIHLKEKLILNQEKIQKQNMILEESLSEIYAYSFPTLKKHLTKELVEFIDLAKNNTILQKMLDQDKLKEYIEQKVQKELKEHEKEKEEAVDMAKNKRELIQLLEQEKGRMNRKLQNLRAKGLIQQNSEKEEQNIEKFDSEVLKEFQNELQKWKIE